MTQPSLHSNRSRPTVRLPVSGMLLTMLLTIAMSHIVHASQDPYGAASLPKTSDLGELDTAALRLRSATALVADQYGRRIYAKRSGDVKPIASVTKLMTAMVVLDAGLPMDERITILDADRDRLRHSRSRLRTNLATLSRRKLLTIALMSSENRAAAALGRSTFPGGTPTFVEAMNRKAKSLGMWQSHFADATGLNAANMSTAEDLVRMLHAAARYPIIRKATTTAELTVSPYASGTTLDYRNTNPLIRNANPNWNIGLSKTGYLNEAGRCLVMQAGIGGRTVYIVLLDAVGKLTPVGDSNRVRKWLESELQSGHHWATRLGAGRG